MKIDEKLLIDMQCCGNCRKGLMDYEECKFNKGLDKKLICEKSVCEEWEFDCFSKKERKLPFQRIK